MHYGDLKDGEFVDIEFKLLDWSLDKQRSCFQIVDMDEPQNWGTWLHH